MIAVFKKTLIFLDLIKFQHTLFVLPFAILSACLAARGVPDARTCIWILIAMVGARTAAMAFNRLADERYDCENPRTAGRHLPKGLMRRGEVWAYTVLAAGIFVIASYSLNRLTFLLSPVALAVILGYSLSKRFTSFSHFWLGFGLSIAPAGAWIAVTGQFAVPPLWLAAVVLLWTAGFDIIYACMDYDYDVNSDLYSIPKRFGIVGALRISALLHLLMLIALAGFMLSAQLGAVSWIGFIAVAILLAYEHRIVRPDELGRVNTAFFNVNAIISFGLMVTTLLDLWLLP